MSHPVPAEKPTIRDLSASPSGNSHTQRPASQLAAMVGPHNEGARLVLECETNGGWPEPTLTWWRDGQLVDDTYEIISQPDGLVIDRVRASATSWPTDEPADRVPSIDQQDEAGPSDDQGASNGELVAKQAAGQARLIRNRLEIAQLTRNDLLANYSCRAWNTRLAEPPSSSVMIDMNRKYQHQ